MIGSPDRAVQKPGGTMICAALSGLVPPRSVTPGLTPGAILFRPFGARLLIIGGVSRQKLVSFGRVTP